jgi:hypothetical protein
MKATKEKDPTRKRHHASKHYKKANGIQDHIIDTENPNHETMRQLASDWWNSWHETTFIKSLVDAYYYKPKERKFDKPELLNGDAFQTLKEKRESILKKEYYKLKKDIPHIHKMMNALTFNTIFMYCIPHFLEPWLKEEEMSKKKKITGDLQVAIIQFLHGSKSIVSSSLFAYLEDLNYFEARSKGEITTMISKKYINKIELNNKEYYSASKDIEFYNGEFLKV